MLFIISLETEPSLIIFNSLSNKVSLENSDWEIIVQVLGNKTGISIIRTNSILSVDKQKRVELD